MTYKIIKCYKNATPGGCKANPNVQIHVRYTSGYVQLDNYNWNKWFALHGHRIQMYTEQIIWYGSVVLLCRGTYIFYLFLYPRTKYEYITGKLRRCAHQDTQRWASMMHGAGEEVIVINFARKLFKFVNRVCVGRIGSSIFTTLSVQPFYWIPQTCLGRDFHSIKKVRRLSDPRHILCK